MPADGPNPPASHGGVDSKDGGPANDAVGASEADSARAEVLSPSADGRSERVETAIESAASAVGAGFGLLVAGPVGAIAGGAAVPVLVHVAKSIRSQWSRRAEMVLQPSTDSIGEDEVAAVLDSDPVVAALVTRSIAESAQVLLDEHARAMGYVLKDVLRGTFEATEANDIITTIAGLNPSRVAVLRDLRDSPSADENEGHWDGHLVERLPLPRGQVRGALTGLEQSGAVASIGAAWDGGDRWQLEQIGRNTLRYIEEAADADNA